jgi:hypothetical protein
MSVFKIAGLIGLALAVIAAFVMIPYVGLVIAAAGLVIGWGTPADAYVRVIVSALALRAFAATFDAIPGAGPYITTILGNVSVLVAGAALMIILRNIYNRMRD